MLPEIDAVPCKTGTMQHVSFALVETFMIKTEKDTVTKHKNERNINFESFHLSAYTGKPIPFIRISSFLHCSIKS